MSSLERLIERIGDAAAIEVVMDVGAHIGDDSIPVARKFPQLRVFAIEPTPSLAARLRETSRALPNYTVIEAAIGKDEVERTFNLVGKGLAGLNSLNEYAPGVEQVVGQLPPVTERIRVRTRRLDAICDERDLDSVDLVHIDTQGSDLDVLSSLGDRLDRVKAGAIEVGNRLLLYVTSVRRDEARAFLESKGFVVVDVRPVNDNDSEQNLLFVHRRVERGFLARHAPGLLYRMLIVRCAWQTRMSHARRAAEDLRARAAVRTRARRLAGGRG